MMNFASQKRTGINCQVVDGATSAALDFQYIWMFVCAVDNDLDRTLSRQRGLDSFVLVRENLDGIQSGNDDFKVVHVSHSRLYDPLQPTD